MSGLVGGGSAPEAVLWDFDGTLVDSQAPWTATWVEMASRRDRPWGQENSLSLVGLDLVDAARIIAQHLGTDEAPSALVDEMVSGVAQRMSGSVPWQPGVPELLASLRRSAIRCALVTMSYRTLVEPVVERLPEGTFEAVVTGDEVAHGKPHPEPYLTAAAALGVDPARCWAVEDSATGIASARAAGCRVIAVPHEVHVAVGPDDRVVPTLAGLDVAGLRRLMEQR